MTKPKEKTHAEVQTEYDLAEVKRTSVMCKEALTQTTPQSVFDESTQIDINVSKTNDMNV